ncbi:MAG: hypothetical protein MjAS7_2598 [Metallosphaera javensis (ex Sakai et al. 2022)]|nr:MAG: hypothetical protein MjAS7_2598 [Metallosphaera javensis (ex Sakai et al. 2022)]
MRFSSLNLLKPRIIAGILLLVFALNPITELEEFRFEPLFMASHYALFIGGFLLSMGRKYSPLLVLPAVFLVVLWHVPFFYALAGTFSTYRIINDLSLLLAGVLAGGSSNSLSFPMKLLLFVGWMGADSVLSVILIVGWPPYSNQVYSFSPYSVGQEVVTGLTMFGIMTTIFVVVLFRLLRSVFNI